MPLDQSSRQQEQPPIRIPDYANQAAMIAAQASQVSGWMYHDGTSLWQYLGTTTGTIADYRQVGGGAVASVSGPWIDNTDAANPVVGYQSATARASNTCLFDKDYIIGNTASITGNVLFDFTGAKLGASTEMKHEDASAFTFPSEALLMFDPTDPVHGIRTDIPNYLLFIITDVTASSEIVKVFIDHENGGA